MDILIRQERTAECSITEEMIKKAFLNEKNSDNSEHVLVNRIRKLDAFIPELSLVAVNQHQGVLGHILLSKIKIVASDRAVESLALAPISVIPGYQNKGIGSQLMHVALNNAKDLGYHSVIVLGHKDYYPKFGFKPASLWNIQAPFDVPDDVFMALELTENALKDVQGVVHYSKAFLE